MKTRLFSFGLVILMGCSGLVMAQCPTISLGSMPIICAGDSVANQTYSAVTGSPVYRITWGDTAVAAGFRELPAIITTIAGSLHPGEGGPAVSTTIGIPVQIATDTIGNFYFADVNSNSVKKVDTAGIITTVAGNYSVAFGAGTYTGDGGPATNAGLNQPVGVAIDHAGNIYIADGNNYVIRKVNTSGIISTIAGTGVLGYSGDGGAATAATLSGPGSIITDAAGDVFFIDGTNVVRKINTSGVISTVAGNYYSYSGYSGDGGPATAAGIPSVSGIAIDGSGNLYLSESPYNVVRKVNTSGVISRFAGSFSYSGSYSGDGGQATAAQLNQPGGLSVDASGNLYIADAENNVIRKVSTSGVIHTVSGNYALGVGNSGDGGPATAATLWRPNGVTVSNTGKMYILSSILIRMVNTGGIINTVAGSSHAYTGDGGPATSAGLATPYAVTGDAAGNVYVADLGNNVIRKINTAGTITTVAGNGSYGSYYETGPATANGLESPEGIAVDANGNLYISDTHNNVVRKVDTFGNISTFAGGFVGYPGYSGDGGQATDAAISYPAGLVVDAAGNVYFADQNNNVIRKVDGSGVITTVAGNYSSPGYYGDGGPATDAGIDQPTAVAVDNAGNLYIADLNYAIRKVDATGMITTVAGNNTFSGFVYSGDGGPATAASFGTVSGIAVDSLGNLYISAGYLLRVNTAGIINKISGGSAGYTGSGVPATGAGLSSFGLGVDRLGNVLIADGGYNLVQVVSTISTLPVSPIHISVPPTAPAGTYSGALTVYNSTCHTTYPLSVEIAPSAGPISGTPSVCKGSNRLLSVPYTGGTWSSSNTGIATAGTTGLIHGVNGGTVNISYQLTSACGTTTATRSFTVDQNPALGTMPAVCTGDTVAHLSYTGVSGNPQYRVIWNDTATSAGFAGIPGGAAVISTYAGNYFLGPFSYSGDGGPATAAGLNSPTGLANDAAGNLYIADKSNNVIRKVDGSGIITTVAGKYALGAGYSGDGGPATAARLNQPTGLAFDVSGNMYIATEGSLVRKVDATGTITTIAGNNSLGYGYSGDGGAATDAQLYVPYGVAVDVSGNVYISDIGSHVVRKVNTAGIITTVAGNNSLGSGYSGDGGPATNAQINSPAGLAVDIFGNLFIAEEGNSVIRKVDTSGIISTIAGTYPYAGYSGDGGPASAAQISQPWGLSIDATGNLYFADLNNNVVREISKSGIINTVAGHHFLMFYSGDGGPATAAGMMQPVGVTVDGTGNIFIADQFLELVRKVTVTDTLPASPLTFAVPGGVPNGTYNGTMYVYNSGCDTTYPVSVTIAPGSGNITGASVACSGATISLTDSSTGGSWSSTNTGVATVGSTGVVTGVAGGVDSIKYTVTSACGTHFSAKIIIINPTPAFTSLSASPVICNGDTSAAFTYSGITGSPLYSLAWSDTAEERGFAGTPALITTYAGNNALGDAYSGDGGPATAAGLSQLRGLAYDGAGNLFIADAENNVIRKVDASGNISTVAGSGSTSYAGDGGPAVAAGLNHPAGVSVDPSGNLYIADEYNNAVRKVNPAGIITTIAGNGSSGYSGDGGAATAANLNQPADVKTDAAGNVYIADYYNNVIRKVDTSGVITTVAGNSFPAYSGDGGPATDASLKYPHALVIDVAGNLIIADNGNNLVRKVDSSGIISTIAGNHFMDSVLSFPFLTDGYRGDGGMATDANLYNPYSLALDGSGNLYIADVGNNVVRKVDPLGKISTLAGLHGAFGYAGDGGPATAASFAAATGLATDGAGNLYVSDANDYVVRKISTVTTLPGSPISVSVPHPVPNGTYHGTIGLFSGGCSATYPVSVTLAPGAGIVTGNKVVCAGASMHLTDTSAGGTWSSSNSGVATIGSTGLLSGVSAGSVTISYNHTGTCGTRHALFPVTVNPLAALTLGAPPAVCLGDTIANLAYSGLTGSPAYSLSWSDTALAHGFGNTPDIITTIAGDFYSGGYSGDGGPASSAILYGPSGMVSDAAGNIYFADQGNSVIRRKGTDGIITTVAGGGSGGDGGPATAAAIMPFSVAVDHDGNMYIAEVARIRKVNTAGIITTFAGLGNLFFSPMGAYFGDGGPAVNAALSNYSTGVAVDAAGNVYIADQGNHAVRKVNTAGIITTFAGNGTAGYSGDGGPATNAQLQQPTSVTVDGYGNVYASDQTNYAIRKIDTSGIITTIAGNGTMGFSGDGGPATDASIYAAYHIYADYTGNIYFGDEGNAVARMVNTAGIINTVAGNHASGYGFSGDGGPATAATLSPNGVAVDPSGNLYISSSNCIRKVVKGLPISGSPLAIAIPDSAGAGVFTANLTLYNGGCNSVYPISVTVSSHVPDSGVITGTATVAVGSTTTFSDTVTGGIWSSNDTTIAKVGTTGIVSGIATGSTTISYSVSNACGTSVAVRSVTVNPMLLPITGPSSVCAGTTITLNDSTTGGTWGSSTPSVATVNTTGIVTGITAGIDTISYTHSGSTVTKIITVNAAPAGITGALSVCQGGSATLTTTPTGGIWTSSSPSVAAIGSVTGIVTGVSAGSSNITYMLATGCKTASAFTVNPLPVVSAGANVAICLGQNTVLTATGASTYTWSPSTGLTSSTGSVVTASPASLVIYSVTGISALGCSGTATKTVSVNPLPTIAAGTGTAICSGAATTLTATGGVSYTWLPSTALSATTGATVTASPTVTTTYTVTGANSSGCSNTALKTVTVNPLPVVSAGAGVAVCSGSSATLTATGGTTYFWIPSTGLSATTGASVAASPTVTTVYTLTGTTAGCSNTALVSVSVNPLPNTAVFTSPSATSPCQGNASVVTVNSTTLGTATFTVTYSLSGANVATNLTAILTMEASNGTFTIPASSIGAAGTTTVTIVSITNAIGCVRTIASSNTASFTVKALPAVYTMTGGGSFCTGGTGVTVGLSGSQTGVNYQLYLSGTATGSPVSGTGGSISFGLKTATGTYTVAATNTSTTCMSNMSGSVSITTNSVPAAYSVTGGGSYCSGGTGVHVGLSSSQTGINYQLYRSSTAVGSPVAGTGSALDFGLQTTAGTYTVIATSVSGGCTSNMTGSVVISISAAPVVQYMNGGGTFCSGGVGFHVGLSGSQTGFNYQLYLNGSAFGSSLPGTGSALDWGYQTTAGTYTAIASASGSCPVSMSGTAVINVNPQPTAYSLTGGGAYCLGGSGLHVGLSGSQTGVNYQLYRGGTTLVGYPVSGTGAALDMGNQTTAGTYTVIATSATGGCTNTMTGSSVISVTTPPTPYSVTGGGSYCSGTSGPHIGLANSTSGVNYQLFNGGTPIGSPLPGGTGALDFGSQTSGGTYTIVGTFAGTSCANNMTGSATITVSSIPTTYAVTGGGTFCTGGAGLHVGVSGSVVTVTYYLYRNGVSIGSAAGTGSAIDYGAYTTTGTYTVVAQSTLTSCTSNQTGSAVIATVAPPSAGTITGPTVVHNGGTITLTDGAAGGTWSASNAHVNVGTSGIVTGVSAGSVTISYTVSNGVCAVSATYPITEAGPAPPPAIGIISGNTSVCIGTQTTLSDPVPGGRWSSDNGEVATVDPISGIVTGIAEGIASVSYTLTNYMGTSSVFVPVSVTGAPDAILLTAEPGLEIAAGQSVKCTAVIANNEPSVTYQWLLNGKLVAGAPRASCTFNGLLNGDVVTCTVTGSCGQPISANAKVTVNNDGTGQAANSDIIVVPNPNKGLFTVRGTISSLSNSGSTEKVQIEITDVLGQVIWSNPVSLENGKLNETIQLDKRVANGMYILAIRSAGFNRIVHIVVEN